MGFTLGAMQGGQTAQLRFRAEHAHKMPDTTAGWYFYHKSKNYHTMQGGIREGLRMACKTSGWSCVALGLESTVDRMRGQSDVLSTVVATVSVAGMFSLASKFFGSSLHSFLCFFFFFLVLASLDLERVRYHVYSLCCCSRVGAYVLFADIPYL
jgi:hypothetical protein